MMVTSLEQATMVTSLEQATMVATMVTSLEQATMVTSLEQATMVTSCSACRSALAALSDMDQDLERECNDTMQRHNAGAARSCSLWARLPLAPPPLPSRILADVERNRMLRWAVDRQALHHLHKWA
jgi:hypothetical protein